MRRQGITEQQKLFVDEYLRLRKQNGKQAAINAGYSEKTAQSQASQMLNKTNVKNYLKEREKKLEDDLRNEFFFDAIEARKEMYKIMKSGTASDRDKLTAAKDFLDRAGFKADSKIEVKGEIEANLKGKIEVKNPFEGLTTEQLLKLAEGK